MLLNHRGLEFENFSLTIPRGYNLKMIQVSAYLSVNFSFVNSFHSFLEIARNVAN